VHALPSMAAFPRLCVLGHHGRANNASVCAADSGCPGASCPSPTSQFLRCSSAPQIWVPTELLAAWFPGAPLPLNVSLQLEVDGHPWGARFDSHVTKSYRLTKGLRHLPELAGCRITAFRRAAGPAALDLIVSSLQEQREDRGVDCKGRQGLRRPLKPEELERNSWPVVRSIPTLGRSDTSRRFLA
jgi:hypothetical protein